MVKINIATQLNKVMTGTVRAVLAADPDAVDPRRWLGPPRSAVPEEVERLLKPVASNAGRERSFSCRS
jgi:fructose-bisphosphate aldolase, class II